MAGRTGDYVPFAYWIKEDTNNGFFGHIINHLLLAFGKGGTRKYREVKAGTVKVNDP